MKSTGPPAWLLPAEVKAHILLWPSLDVCGCAQSQVWTGVAGASIRILIFKVPRTSLCCLALTPIYSGYARMKKDAEADAVAKIFPLNDPAEYPIPFSFFLATVARGRCTVAHFLGAKGMLAIRMVYAIRAWAKPVKIGVGCWCVL